MEIYCAMAKITLTAKSPAMKLYLPVLPIALFLVSCSTAYKTGQTPDDVYFSPARQRLEHDEYARVEKKENRYYESDEEYREDRYLRMKTRYRRYSVLDGGNFGGYYDYHRHNNWGYYNRGIYVYNNPYAYNPYYNKPYYGGYVYGNVNPVYNKPRTGNLHMYDKNNNYNGNLPTSNGKRYTTPASGNNTDNYRNSGTNAGGFLRNVFGSGSSNTNTSGSSTNSSSNSSSTSTPSSSSSSSSGSGSGSAPVRRF